MDKAYTNPSANNDANELAPTEPSSSLVLGATMFLAAMTSFVNRNRFVSSTLRNLVRTPQSPLERDLRFKSERLRSVLETVPAGIITLNERLFIESWNKTASQTFFYTEQDIMGEAFLKVIAPEFHYLFASRESMKDLGLRANDQDRRLELIGIRKDGTRFPIEFAMNEYVFRKARFYTCIIRDITQGKKITEDLHAARLAADEASTAKSRFLAQMSHEIRTPLGAILGFSDLLIDDDCSAQKKQDYGKAIRRNGWLLSRIINDILDLSKIEAGRLNIELETTETADVFSDVKGFLKLQAKDKGIYLNLHIAQDVPAYIHTAPLRVRQIIINLVGNAVKFTERGGVTVDVRLVAAARLCDYRLKISVSDTGCGIKHTVFNELFEPFSQATSFATAQYHGSTGLGLALSKKIANLLGGDIYLVESTPNKGTTFAIEIDPGLDEIPSLSSPLACRSKINDKEAKTLGNSDLSGCKVLLAEDSPDNQLLIATFLRRAGAQVEIANHGRECVEKVGKGHYDLVLMDLQMPVMDGYEALRELQHIGYKEPVIAITAHALREERKRCLTAGFSAHMSKPVDRAVLIETLKGFMHH